MFPWATLGANDINKPFSEMTPEDKAIMRGKYETEIVETESDYIDKLRLIKELYMAPLVALTKTGNEKNAIITATHRSPTSSATWTSSSTTTLSSTSR